MFSTLSLSITLLIYMGILFGLAIIVERRARTRTLRGQAWIYALSFAVFFTSWTFYGSVGYAIEYGLQFAAIYIGALIGLLGGSVALKRMILVKQNFRLTSIADLISTRYRRSQRIAALVTCAAIIGLLPYIVLQLRAISSAFDILSTSSSSTDLSLDGLTLTLLMAAITIVFGVRRVDPTERHQGIIAVLVAECVVKLLALLVVGFFITYQLFDGFGDILQQLDQQDLSRVYQLGAEGSGYTWIAMILLGASAILMLPRQFHVAVVENGDPEHLKQALTLFPIYTILINLFVIPIAGAGLLMGLPASAGDQFVLLIPLTANNELISLIAFIGGFSAATGMILVTTLTLATMASNHLLIPLWRRYHPNANFGDSLLQIRWALVVIILLSAHLFASNLEAPYILVNLGLISFAAVLQLAPAGLLGLFWKKGNSLGAALGLLTGYAVWGYTLVVPAMVLEGWVSASILSDGLLGLSWLKPESLFYSSGLTPLAHSVFWSLGLNLLMYLIGSLIYKPQKAERTLSNELFDCMQRGDTYLHRSARPTGLEAYIGREAKIEEAERLLNRYLSSDKADQLLSDICADLQLGARPSLTIIELMEFHRMLEHRLAGSIGAAGAHSAIEESIRYTDREAADLRSLFSHLASEIGGVLAYNRRKTDRSGGEGYDLLVQLQDTNEKQSKELIALKARCEQLEAKLDAQYSDVFRYRVDAQNLQVENDRLRAQLKTEQQS